MERIRVVLASEHARLPARATDGSAGYDLYACESVLIESGKRQLVDTGVMMEVPLGYYGRIAPRSSLAWKSSIDVGAGVIDPDYRSKIGVLLINNGTKPFLVKIGDRIAQIIITAIITPELVLCDELSITERGEGGFGSTGK
jgi:dUTP pyrophosphatase